jgi:hypothetical protein
MKMFTIFGVSIVLYFIEILIYRYMANAIFGLYGWIDLIMLGGLLTESS